MLRFTLTKIMSSSIRMENVSLITNSANKGLSSQSYGFSSSHVWMWELDYKESWALKNWYFWSVVLEKTPWESLGLQEDQSSQSWRKPVLNIHWKDWCWSWNSNTLATWWEELTHWKRPWCWERLKAGGEGDDRGWDGWMASLTQWTWVWASSRSWWWHATAHGVTKSQTWLRDWTEPNNQAPSIFYTSDKLPLLVFGSL